MKNMRRRSGSLSESVERSLPQYGYDAPSYRYKDSGTSQIEPKESMSEYTSFADEMSRTGGRSRRRRASTLRFACYNLFPCTRACMHALHSPSEDDDVPEPIVHPKQAVSDRTPLLSDPDKLSSFQLCALSHLVY